LLGLCAALVDGKLHTNREKGLRCPETLAPRRFPKASGAGLVLNRSIGGVRLGELRAKVERRIGKGRPLPERPKDVRVPDDAQVVHYAKADLSVVYAPARPPGQRAIEISTSSTGYRLRASGIGVGSWGGDVLARLTKYVRASGDRLDKTHMLVSIGYLHGRPGTTFILYVGPPAFDDRVVRVVVANGRLTVWGKAVNL
jgi:hypothetical protein